MAVSHAARRLTVALFAALLAAGFVASSAQGQRADAARHRVSLGEALQLFNENNLSLQRSRAEVRRMRGLARQTAAYPNPRLQATHEPLWRDGAGQSETYLNLSQRVAWSGREGRIEAARQHVDAARARARADRARLAFQVAEAYVRAAAAEARLRRLERVTHVFRRADSSFAVRETAGDASGYAVRRVRLERARYEQRLAAARLGAQTARQQLALLILPGEASTVTPERLPDGRPPAVSEQEALRIALRERPEQRRWQAEVDAQQAALQAARRARWPDPTITAGYKRQSNGFEGLFLGAAFPLPMFDRNQGQIEAETARLAAAQSDQALVRREVRNDVRRTQNAYASLHRQHRRIGRDLLPGTDDVLRIAQASYAEGEMSLVELLDAADAYRDAQIRAIDLRADLWTRYFDLLRATGQTIQIP